MNHLAAEEQNALVSHMQEITGDSGEACRELLERYQWNLELAVSERLREEDDSRLQRELQHEENEHVAAPNGSTLRQRNTNVNDSPSSSNSSATPEPIGRNVERHGLYSFLRSIALKPLWFLWRFVTDTLRFFSTMLFQPARIGGGLEDVRAFVRRFETELAPNANTVAAGEETHPRFFIGTYAQALAAAKRDLRFLLVYLHGDDHQDTLRFCRETLCSPDVIRFLNANVTFWACNTNCEEGYRVSQALRENTYPFFGLIVLRQSKMTMIGRLEGFMSAQMLIQRLTTLIRDNEIWVVQERIEREERRSAASLRAQQDRAYEDAIRVDAERMQRQADAEKLAVEARNEVARRERRATAIQLARAELRALYGSAHARTCSILETSTDATSRRSESDEGALRLSIKLPDGTRLEGRFAREDSIKRVCGFIVSDDRAPSNFALLQNFPRRELPVSAFCTRLAAFASAFADAGTGTEVHSTDEPPLVRRLLVEHGLLDAESDSTTTTSQSDGVTLSELGLQRTEMLFVNDLDA